jgi:hypothetical protein
MVQSNLFPHEVKNSKQPQRNANTARGTQPPTRTAPQAGVNRQIGERHNRYGYGQPAAKQASQSNRASVVGRTITATSKRVRRIGKWVWSSGTRSGDGQSAGIRTSPLPGS